jgi:hypothetical protein
MFFMRIGAVGFIGLFFDVFTFTGESGITVGRTI